MNTTTETSGKIDLIDGYTFHWMLGGERCPEVYGFTQTPNGATVKGSGGWFRTTDPQAAARIARLNLRD